MKPERWAQIQQAFDAAVEMELPDRSAHLDRVCGTDAELRREIESLLQAHSDSGDFLERPGESAEGKAGFQPGGRVHQYEILSLLGAGGMGEVYLARDTRLQRPVALKLLPRGPNFAREQLLRFEQEARAASALSHANVCVIYEINETEAGDHYIAMEYVEGATLREHLARGPIPAGEALAISLQVGSGLSAAHKAGIIHRDIKPENIMLRNDSQVKLLDFGVAKLYADQEAPTAELSILRTQPGMVIGTFKYMSPEQARGAAVDGRSDLWSLGVVLYEMLAGSPPFRASTQTDVLVAILTQEPATLSRALPNVSEGLEKLVGRLLSKDVQARYQTAEELMHDLEGARAESLLPSRKRLLPALRLFAIAVMLVLVAGAGLLYYRRVEARKYTTSTTASATDAHRRVVALLPFENISHDPDQEYFTEGMGEEISGQLSKLASLQLISRAAVARHKNSLSDLRQIGQELGAGSLITGAVRQDRGRVRVNVELIDPQTERTIWSEQYDRALKDIFAVQSEIALRIARQLGAELSPLDQEHIEKRPTDNLDAYRLYLRARALPMGVRKDNLEAIQILEKALSMDPRFATALAYMSYRQQYQAFLGDQAYLELAMENARKALAIDPNLAEAQFSLASAYWFNGELSHARVSFLKALELKPNFVEAMNNYSLEELGSGRADDAIYWAARSFRLMPNWGNSYYHLTAPLLVLGDDATAERWISEGEHRYPKEERLKFTRAIFDFVCRGKRNEGLQKIRDAVSASPDNEELVGILIDLSLMAGTHEAAEQLPRQFRIAPDSGGTVLAESNRLKYAYVLRMQGDIQTATHLAEEAEKKAQKELQEGDESYVLPLELAASFSFRGNPQKALEWLGLAYTKGARDYRTLESDPFFEKLHTEARFKELVRRMVADVAQMRAHAQQQLPEIFSPDDQGHAAVSMPSVANVNN